MRYVLPLDYFFKNLSLEGWGRFCDAVRESDARQDPWTNISAALHADYGAVVNPSSDTIAFRSETDYIMFKMRWS